MIPSLSPLNQLVPFIMLLLAGIERNVQYNLQPDSHRVQLQSLN